MYSRVLCSPIKLYCIQTFLGVRFQIKPEMRTISKNFALLIFSDRYLQILQFCFFYEDLSVLTSLTNTGCISMKRDLQVYFFAEAERICIVQLFYILASLQIFNSSKEETHVFNIYKCSAYRNIILYIFLLVRKTSSFRKKIPTWLHGKCQNQLNYIPYVGSYANMGYVRVFVCNSFVFLGAIYLQIGATAPACQPNYVRHGVL